MPCWLCCFFPPPPPPPVYVRPPPVYVVDQNPVLASVPVQPREVTVLEFRQGDTPLKYALTVPYEADPGRVLRVKLGGTDFSIRLPEYLERGEKIIVIAPAATGTAAVSVSTPFQSAESSAPAPREIRAMEFRDGDVPSKYSYVIPMDAVVGQVVSVALSGRDFNIRVPDYVRQGETVIIIAPAALI